MLTLFVCWAVLSVATALLLGAFCEQGRPDRPPDAAPHPSDLT